MMLNLFRLSAALSTMLIALAAISSAQGTKESPELKDLAGEWELVTGESETRFGPPYLSGSLVVKVRGEEVTISRSLEDRDGTVERELSYYGDGRGELNVWMRADGEYTIERKSKSKWKSGKLLIKWSQKSNMGWYNVEEIYSLNKEGNVLTFRVMPQIIRPGLTRAADYAEKLVFRRKG
jgi:hypothetical protein